MELKGNIYYNNEFHKGIVSIENGIITDINFVPVASDDYIVPGFIDTHFHGCDGADFSDGSIEGLKTIARYQKHHGVVGICPATMTIEKEDITKACHVAAAFSKEENKDDCASLLGVYIEGPFISPKKCGAQRTDCILPPSEELVRELMEASDNLVKVIALAPEMEGSQDFIKKVKMKYPWVHISLAHTMADYDVARQAMKNGADRLTHYYNAMEHYDEIGRAFVREVGGYAELICDGIHNDTDRILNAFKLFGADRIILISDSMRATGKGDGKYTLGGQKVTVNGRLATLDNGAKAGSVSNLFDCFKVAVEMGVPLADALRAVSENPAKSIGVFDRLGGIEKGKESKILVLDKKLNIKM